MSRLFNVQNINISKLIQKESYEDQAEVVIITDKVQESKFQQLKTQLKNASCVLNIDSVIRVGL